MASINKFQTGTAKKRTKSLKTPLTTSPVCVPFTKITVLGSSISLGSRASRARLDLAFLGFLCKDVRVSECQN